MTLHYVFVVVHINKNLIV